MQIRVTVEVGANIYDHAEERASLTLEGDDIVTSRVSDVVGSIIEELVGRIQARRLEAERRPREMRDMEQRVQGSLDALSAERASAKLQRERGVIGADEELVPHLRHKWYGKNAGIAI